MHEDCVVETIKCKFKQIGSPTQIPKIRPGTFEAEIRVRGVHVSNLGNKPCLPWDIFRKTLTLLRTSGGCAEIGDAMMSRLGDDKLSLNTVEGHIASEFDHKAIGDAVFRRGVPIRGILVWAGVCYNGRGTLCLQRDWVESHIDCSIDHRS